MGESLLKIGITHGDMNGIGYELILKALSDNRMSELCTPVVYGVSKVCSLYKNQLELTDFTIQVIKKIEQANLKKSNLLNITDQEVKAEPGQATERGTKMAEDSLSMAVRDIKNKQLDVIVTAPMSTVHAPIDFLSSSYDVQNVMNILLNGNQRICIPYLAGGASAFSSKLNADFVYNKIKSAYRILKSDFSCTNPTIAVLSVNQSGDVICQQDKDFLIPAIGKAFEERVNVFGPFAVNAFLDKGGLSQYDAVLVLTPALMTPAFKQCIRRDAVWYSAGLPFVRTAPVNSVSYEMSGKNLSDGQSMRNAIYTAVDIHRTRQSMAEYVKK